MLDILLSQPGTIFYAVFVLTFLLWALWTRQPPRAPAPNRLQARPKTPLGPAGDFRKRFDGPLVVNRPPPALREVHASCSADYNLKFAQLDERIQRHDG
jgi:hypothetical protein